MNKYTLLKNQENYLLQFSELTLDKHTRDKILDTASDFLDNFHLDKVFTFIESKSTDDAFFFKNNKKKPSKYRFNCVNKSISTSLDNFVKGYYDIFIKEFLTISSTIEETILSFDEVIEEDVNIICSKRNFDIMNAYSEVKNCPDKNNFFTFRGFINNAGIYTHELIKDDCLYIIKKPKVVKEIIDKHPYMRSSYNIESSDIHIDPSIIFTILIPIKLSGDNLKHISSLKSTSFILSERSITKMTISREIK